MSAVNGRSSDAEAADVVVIGAGVAGLCAARAAIGQGHGVVVVEGSRPAASTVAAGMIAPVGELSWGEEPLHRAAVAAAAAWPGFAAELEQAGGGPLPYRRCGALHLALDRDEAAELRRRGELIDEHAMAAERLTPSDARELEPGLSPSVTSALWAAEEAEIDPRALIGALRSAVEREARFIPGDATAIEVVRGRVGGVALAEGGLVPTERAVVAAGAWSSELLGADGPRVRPVKGEILTLRPRGGEELPCERIIVTERVYLVPRSTGELVVGATTTEHGFDLSVTAGGVHELLREAYRVLPEIAEMELVDIAAGLRPGSPDNAPLLGAAGPAGLVLATGGYRNGILLAPLLGPAVAAALVGEPAPTETAAFAPTRFSVEAPA